MGIEFDKIVLKREHILLSQFLQIHKYIIKRTYQTVDEYRLERREAMMDSDKEGYKYYVLAQLAGESDCHDRVMDELEQHIEGFTADLFEKDTYHYKMNRLCAE